MRWILASAISALGLTLSFLALRACLLLWVSVKALVILTLPWLFVFLVIGLQGWKRAVIPPLVVVVGIISLMPHFNPMPIAATESSAVGALVRIRRALEDRSASLETAVNDGLSKQNLPLQRFYRFEPEARQGGYRIVALLTTQARSCGCIRNFVIESDGVVHYTVERRPATESDPVVDLPFALAGTPMH